MTTQQPVAQYRLSPQSPETFTLVEINEKNEVLTKNPRILDPDEMNYNGLYKFLYFLRKIKPEHLGMLANEAKQLPSVDLMGPPVATQAFREANSDLNELRAKIKTFIRNWFVASIDAKNIGQINVGANAQIWENKNTVSPSLPAGITRTNEGVFILEQETMSEKADSISKLTEELKLLTLELQQCTTDPQKCVQAQTHMADVNAAMARLRNVIS